LSSIYIDSKIGCDAHSECNMNWLVFVDFDPSKSCMRFMLLWRYLDAALGSLCISNSAILSAKVVIETFVSASKSVMYDKYRNEPRTLL